MSHRNRRNDTHDITPLPAIQAEEGSPEPKPANNVFITKDDLSRFLSIKPYLSDRAQMLVDLIAEVERAGGRLDGAVLIKLLSLAGQNEGNPNISSLLPLLNMLGSLGGATEGKADPGALASLLAGMIKGGGLQGG